MNDVLAEVLRLAGSVLGFFGMTAGLLLTLTRPLEGLLLFTGSAGVWLVARIGLRGDEGA